MMTAYIVHAAPAPHAPGRATTGWDLRVEGHEGDEGGSGGAEASAHVRSLAKVPERARALVAALLEADGAQADGRAAPLHADEGDPGPAEPADVTIVLDLRGLDEQARESRRQAAEAAEALERASRRTREIARSLQAMGLSVTDIGVVLGVSQARASQLLSA